MTTTEKFLKEILVAAKFPPAESIADLVGTPVKLLIETGSGDYDVIGTTIRSARMRLGDGKWDWRIEFTFDPQAVSSWTDGYFYSYDGYRLVSASHWCTDRRWNIQLEARGWRRFVPFLCRTTLRGEVSPARETVRIKAAA